jgi:MoxR-like ATPase
MSISLDSVESLQTQLESVDYFADSALTTAIYLSLKLGKPLLLEGEVGVGKTELAKALTKLSGRRLIRLQCYEGIDANQAIYEWDYAKQLMFIRAYASDQGNKIAFENLYSDDFLQVRPLLEALRSPDPVVLLIDEVDRADDEFEAFLLEFLSDFQVSIPELGTITSKTRPVVILTSNRTRELHDALKRRCLYSWIGFPAASLEVDIITRKLPNIGHDLVTKVVSAVNKIRTMDLAKVPGVAEAIDWAESLDAVANGELSKESAMATIGAVIKDREDLEMVKHSINEIVEV